MGCQEGGDAGFKTMGDNDFNFMCDVGLTMSKAPFERECHIHLIASHYL